VQQPLALTEGYGIFFCYVVTDMIQELWRGLYQGVCGPALVSATCLINMLTSTIEELVRGQGDCSARWRYARHMIWYKALPERSCHQVQRFSWY
jgi:hypothetical protein